MTSHDFSGYDPNTTFTKQDDASDAPSTLYDIFRKEVQENPDVDTTIDLPVRGRPFSVRYSLDVTLDKLDRWRKVATPNKRRPEDVDSRMVALLVIREQCEGIMLKTDAGKSELIKNDAGEVLTFKSEDVADLMGVMDPNAVIAKFYPGDADLLRVGNKITEAAGYDLEGNELEDDDDPLV